MTNGTKNLRIVYSVPNVSLVLVTSERKSGQKSSRDVITTRHCQQTRIFNSPLAITYSTKSYKYLSNV